MFLQSIFPVSDVPIYRFWLLRSLNIFLFLLFLLFYTFNSLQHIWQSSISIRNNRGLKVELQPVCSEEESFYFSPLLPPPVPPPQIRPPDVWLFSSSSSPFSSPLRMACWVLKTPRRCRSSPSSSAQRICWRQLLVFESLPIQLNSSKIKKIQTKTAKSGEFTFAVASFCSSFTLMLLKQIAKNEKNHI